MDNKKPSKSIGNDMVCQAKEQLAQLTGLNPDTVSGLRQEESGWQVTLEMIEMRRIPEASDLLATYEVHLGNEGNLIEYRRTRRYHRGQVMEAE